MMLPMMLMGSLLFSGRVRLTARIHGLGSVLGWRTVRAAHQAGLSRQVPAGRIGAAEAQLQVDRQLGLA